MKNEDINETEFVHLFLALRRSKDKANEGLQQLCFRELVYGDGIQSLEALKSRVKSIGGEWRIHKTINKRSVHKALQQLQHKIIEDPVKVAERLPSEWKTCLMLPKCKAERNILLDIDSNKAYKITHEIIEENSIEMIDMNKSPNGWHVVINAENVDTRLFQGIEDLEFKRDGYIYIESVTGEEDV